jgi:Flp pilus assembly protein TadD
MSLLLDALKKAAQEKQNSDVKDVTTESRAHATEAYAADRVLTGNNIYKIEKEQPEELELHNEVMTLSTSAEAHTPEDEGIAAEAPLTDHRIVPTPSTVTDEALQLLIHKTNRAHKKSRLITLGGIVVASLMILTVGGLYFHLDMLAEIETMQRKHQIALSTLKSKTKIEETLTSLAAVSETGTQTGTVKKSESNTVQAASRQRTTIPAASVNKTAEQAFSVQRAHRRDPLSEALQRGWAAFHNKDYELSGREYRNVLYQEPDNHDALLGLAAVSMQQNDSDTAREIYIRLLELDPRDTHAHAGLANIAQMSGADLSETRLKQLIEYRPDDAHLQFALGNLYIQKKSWPEAQQAFFNALKADSQNPDYAYNLAVSLDHLGKHKAAKLYYEDSLELASGKNVSFSADVVKSRLAYLGAMQ